jgi:imidazolonepropionase-like amidohydrolase
VAILLRDATIIDGKGDRPFKGYIVIEGGRFEKVEKGPGPSPKAGWETIDLDGRTVLPGIIDCHVHLCMDGDPDPTASMERDSVSLVTLKAARNARITLMAGVTTVRDVGDKSHTSLSLRDAVASGICAGPRILSSGQLICMTGGQGWNFGRQADGPDEVRRAVREQLRAGTDSIKLMATGGVLTPGVEAGAPQLTYEELKAGVEEAHKGGRKAATHAQGTEGIKNALRAGMDTIEHGVGIDDEAIDLFLKTKAAVVPTLCAPFHILDKGERSGIPDFIIKKTERVNEIHLDSIRKAFHARVTIAMGTDAGTPFNRHGENMKELELMTRVGFTSMEAITASTRTAAEILGLGARTGTIGTGKLADLLIVEGDPVADISLLQKQEKIAGVMKEGRFYKRTF